MTSLLNQSRPPVFCPGCSHEKIAQALDQALRNMGLRGDQVVIVSDIGCSGLFDTFFNTHALHGLHGRALTYAAGLKLARPELHVIVTMGDGGLGIGGAHLLSACRRNLDINLLVLNNFNFGMTGGQFSPTTPPDARVESGFLNNLEKPFDVCQVTAAAGAPYVVRCSGYQKDLAEVIEKAIRFEGFSVVETLGVCTGRYTRYNRLTPRMIDEQIVRMTPYRGLVLENMREEYGRRYWKIASALKPVSGSARISAQFEMPRSGRQGVVILGSAGQRVITAGEILCLAGMSAGLQVTQKSDYPITVLRGHSISEVILSPEPVNFTGIEHPSVVIAIAEEGVNRRSAMFADLDKDCVVIRADDVKIPDTGAMVYTVDFKAWKIKPQDRALASLSMLTKMGRCISLEMLRTGLGYHFQNPTLELVVDMVDRIAAYDIPSAD